MVIVLFSETLEKYIELTSCTAKELAQKSGISASVISRYRNGERTPQPGSIQIEKLAEALASIAKENSISGCEKEIIMQSFNAENGEEINTKVLIAKLNTLISLININITDFARYCNFDPSYISKIRSGKRIPADPEDFAHKIAEFTAAKYGKQEDIKRMILNQIELAELTEPLEKSIFSWLCNGKYSAESEINEFLTKLDDFDLNEYIKAIHFNDIKVPSTIFNIPFQKTYTGLEQMKLGEINFIKATVLSKSKENFFMCADMPMEDMASDKEFSKRWMMGLAVMLKKNLHFDVIHNLNRPLGEMMLGLESWIPLYMTGQISPYYFASANNSSVYQHLLYVSGEAALNGECISGHHSFGRYNLYRSREDVAYFKEESRFLLKKAQPLMHIYKKDSSHTMQSYFMAAAMYKGERKNILSAPPLFTASTKLLQEILENNHINSTDSQTIIDAAENQKKIIFRILNDSTMTDEIAMLSKEEFKNSPVPLSLSSAFYETDVFYTYEQYCEHFKQTESFMKEQKNYQCKFTPNRMFSNIQISICKGKMCIISKSKSPAIHFVIKHPKLLNAIENLVLPIVDD